MCLVQNISRLCLQPIFALQVKFYRIGLAVALQWNTGSIQNPYHTHGSFDIDIPLTIVRYFTNHMYNSRFFVRL